MPARAKRSGLPPSGTGGKGETITSAPLYYDGLVITGLSGGEFGVRGSVTAYDAETGKLVWRFYTIPGPGETGHETWPQDNDAWKHGGAPVWQTPAVDPELGLLYFSTGNTSPDFDGSSRKGDNLFANSIVALDAKTGEYRWHFQQVHHDIWDLDSPSPVVLFDVKIDGQLRHALAEASKTGWVYILDRTNGKPLVGIDERAVPQEPRQHTAATQPYPVGDAFTPQSVTAKEAARLHGGSRSRGKGGRRRRQAQQAEVELRQRGQDLHSLLGPDGCNLHTEHDRRNELAAVELQPRDWLPVCLLGRRGLDLHEQRGRNTTRPRSRQGTTSSEAPSTRPTAASCEARSPRWT